MSKYKIDVRNHKTILTQFFTTYKKIIARKSKQTFLNIGQRNYLCRNCLEIVFTYDFSFENDSSFVSNKRFLFTKVLYLSRLFLLE